MYGYLTARCARKRTQRSTLALVGLLLQALCPVSSALRRRLHLCTSLIRGAQSSPLTPKAKYTFHAPLLPSFFLCNAPPSPISSMRGCAKALMTSAVRSVFSIVVVLRLPLSAALPDHLHDAPLLRQKQQQHHNSSPTSLKETYRITRNGWR
jgi:hypothetical protein